jgi:hypothetical protein
MDVTHLADPMSPRTECNTLDIQDLPGIPLRSGRDTVTPAMRQG